MVIGWLLDAYNCVVAELRRFAGVFGMRSEIKTGREDLRGHLGALVGLLMVGRWALSPVDREELTPAKARRE